MMEAVSTDLIANNVDSVHPLGQALLDWCQPACMLQISGEKYLGHIQASSPGWQTWMMRLVALVEEISFYPDKLSIINTHDENGHHALVSFSKYQISLHAKLKEECWLPIYDVLLAAGLNPVATNTCIQALPQLFADNLYYLVYKVGQAASTEAAYEQEDGGNLLHWPHMLPNINNIQPDLVQSWLVQKRSIDGALPLHLAFREWMETKGQFRNYVIEGQYNKNSTSTSLLMIPIKINICEFAKDHLESQETHDGPTLYELIIHLDKAGLMELKWGEVVAAKAAAYAAQEHAIIKAGTVVHQQEDPIPQRPQRL